MAKLRMGICPTLTSDILIKLQRCKIYSVSDLLAQEVEELVKTIHVSCKDLVALRHVLSAQYAALPISGADLYDEITRSVRILFTGCKILDDYLDGGIYTMEITEVVGEVAAAKSQFCQGVASILAHDAKQKTIWIDSCGSFDVERHQQILRGKGLNDKEVKEVSSRIQVISVFDVLGLLAVMENLADQLANQDEDSLSNVCLIVVDSVTILLSTLLTGYTVEGHSMLVQVSRSLKTLASDYNVAVLVTNSLVGSADLSNKKPALGRVWASVPNTRILLHRTNAHRLNQNGEFSGEGTVRRFATLTKSSRQMCEYDIPFDVDDKGVVDVSL